MYHFSGEPWRGVGWRGEWVGWTVASRVATRRAEERPGSTGQGGG